ncbi:MAG: SDR family oxidoreductase [Phenylobacterium sp.]|uniref:SDR family NAD(P)-dependent oxidoreductase n=1 Tax=Phenylobacterium sp. TaxID=1871053 RepID=UPI001A638626|nr:SDR family oxidoreductase [Phenylobacterium sp.]MBL8772274.1 SDR family oxidoreductase [Phenylobacterium sp.]
MTEARIFRERHLGEVFIVTGAGSGIGAAAARRLALEGAAVTVADVRGATAQAVADEIAAAGGQALAVTCDVSREADVAEMVQASQARFGKLSGLFANAGTAGRGWIHETALEDWQRVLSVNLNGPFLCAKHVLPHLLAAGKGVIVTTGSIASVVIGGAGSAASYAASKGGVLQLTRQIAVDYGPQGIRAACVCPGAVRSNMGANASEDRQRDATPASTPLPRAPHWTPMQRASSPDEIAAVVSFLLSDEASFITGSAVFADGGLLAI